MPEVYFTGPAGRIEGRYHEQPTPNAPRALFLHPHPLHGGTMNNKVVYSLFQGYANEGYNCLRINFRGIGRSEGKYDNGEGEVADAIAALEWLQDERGASSGITVVGYSFGSWIGMQLLMRRPEITNFVSVAPPNNMFDFSFLTPCPHPGLIVYGTNDELVPHTAVEGLVEKLIAQQLVEIEYETIEGANHFFQGYEKQLVELCVDYSRRVGSKTFSQLHRFEPSSSFGGEEEIEEEIDSEFDNE